MDIFRASLLIAAAAGLWSSAAAAQGERPDAQLFDPGTVRRIAPGSISPDLGDSPMVRIAPRPTPSEERGGGSPQRDGRSAGSVPESDWSIRRLYKPHALTATLIDAQGYRIRLERIAAPAATEFCVGGDAPCGLMGRSALRRWLRGRAISCRVPEEAPTDAAGEPSTVTTRCTLGGDDIGGWLIDAGWAVAKDGGAEEGDGVGGGDGTPSYAEREENARRAQRGLHAAGGWSPRDCGTSADSGCAALNAGIHEEPELPDGPRWNWPAISLYSSDTVPSANQALPAIPQSAYDSTIGLGWTAPDAGTDDADEPR